MYLPKLVFALVLTRLCAVYHSIESSQYGYFSFFFNDISKIRRKGHSELLCPNFSVNASRNIVFNQRSKYTLKIDIDRYIWWEIS